MDILRANDRDGAYPPSWYAATVEPLPEFASPRGMLSADVCVIGGGYTGLSAALHLAERGYDVILLEAQRVGFGASGRNGGQLAVGQRVEQTALEALVGAGDARRLWDLSLESVALVHDLMQRHRIDATYVPGLLHADHRARYVPETHAYVDMLRDSYGYDLIRAVDRDEMRALVGSPGYHGGALDMGSGHVHPLRLALGLARAARDAGVRIFEDAQVTALDIESPARVHTANAELRAGHVVLACNGYLGGLSGPVASRVMPINNFIAATEPLASDTARALIRDNHAVADSRFVINYFRLSEDNRLLFGGGESYGYRFPRDIAGTVRRPMTQVFPQLADVRIDYAWGGTVGITMNRMPHFARLAGNVLSASGYSGHGVAMATLGGRLAAEAIAGQAERFDLMASVPSPRFPGGAVFRTPLLVAGMLWYALRDRL